jgi:hypothetical protein
MAKPTSKECWEWEWDMICRGFRPNFGIFLAHQEIQKALSVYSIVLSTFLKTKKL